MLAYLEIIHSLNAGLSRTPAVPKGPGPNHHTLLGFRIKFTGLGFARVRAKMSKADVTLVVSACSKCSNRCFPLLLFNARST